MEKESAVNTFFLVGLGLSWLRLLNLVTNYLDLICHDHLQSHMEEIVAIDWSVTSQFIRFMTSQYNLGIWNIEKKTEEARRSVKRAMQWHTEKCVLGYQTSG